MKKKLQNIVHGAQSAQIMYQDMNYKLRILNITQKAYYLTKRKSQSLFSLILGHEEGVEHTHALTQHRDF